MVEKTRQAVTPALRERAVVSMAMGFSRAAQQTQSINELDEILADRLGEIGIPNFILYQVVDRKKQPSAALRSGRSCGPWRDFYMESNLAAVDHLMLNGAKTREFFTWDQYRNRQGDIPEGQIRIFDHAREFDFVDGFYMPIHQEDAPTYAVSMMATRKLPIDPWMTQSLFLLAYNYLLGVLRLSDNRLTLQLGHENPASLLTPRQRECVMWVRAGKTDWEIAKILGISEQTVIEHLHEARKRLGVRTRTQLVIEAIQRGIMSA